MRATVSLILFSQLATSCAPAPTSQQKPVAHPPNEIDFHWAMEADIPDEIDGRPLMFGHCRKVRHLHCVPLAASGQFECTYRFGRNQLCTAIIERQMGTFWRWVSGPKQCSIVTW